MNLEHLNVKHGAFQNRPTDLISDLLLMNHTLYVYVRAFLEANEMVFLRPSEAAVYAPPEIMDGVEIIHDLITSNTWMKKYKKHKEYLNQISAKMSKVKKESDIAEDEIR